MKSLMNIAAMSILLLSSTVIAGNISINSVAKVDGNELTIVVKNTGTEQAQDVFVEASFDEHTYSCNESENILPESSIVKKLSLDNTKETGTHCGKILISYRDTAGYLFSAPSIFYTHSEQIQHSKMSILVTPPKSVNGAGKVRLINLEKFTTEGELELFTANEFQIVPRQLAFVLEPQKGAEIAFEVKNISAIPVSNYPVYAIVNYKNSGKHYATVGHSMLAISRNRRGYFIATASFVSVVFLIGLVTAKRMFFNKGKNE